MTQDLLDQVIQEATQATETPAEQPIENPKEEIIESAEPAEEVEAESGGDDKEDPSKSDNIQLPKKVLRSIERKEKKIGALHAKLQEREAEIARYRETLAKVPNSDPTSEDVNAPKEWQFENYGDYLKAQAVHEYEIKKQAESKVEEQKQQQVQQQQWVQERGSVMASKAAEAIQNVPGYKELYSEYQDVMNELPDHVGQALLELDNAPMAFYALAKEGKFESILNMSPFRVAIELAKAEERGVAMTKAKQISKAPSPISANKGTGGIKANNFETSADIMQWLNSR